MTAFPRGPGEVDSDVSRTRAVLRIVPIAGRLGPVRCGSRVELARSRSDLPLTRAVLGRISMIASGAMRGPDSRQAGVSLRIGRLTGERHRRLFLSHARQAKAASAEPERSAPAAGLWWRRASALRAVLKT